MSARRVGLSLRMIGRKEGGEAIRRLCNYGFNPTTLSQARRNKPEIILTGWEEQRERGERRKERSEAQGGVGRDCAILEG